MADTDTRPLTPAEVGAYTDTLTATAVAVLHDHTTQNGQCCACGLPWPCFSATLAADALATL